MAGLFGTFNVAKRGIFTQQKALDVTSHNISNAKTEGYSRQRANIETTRPFPMPSLNSAAEAGQLGTGSTISSIQRIRDDFLDYQVRQQNSINGEYSGRDKFLCEVENILNEPSESGLSKLMTKFYDSWEQLSNQSQSSNARTVVTQQSAALANELNHTYKQLTELQNNADEIIRQTTYEVNNVLDQLNQLNQQIISVKVSGQEPNDLMDKRDLIIDNLSQKFGVSIDKRNFQGFDLKPEIDKDQESALTDKVYLLKSNPNDVVSRFSYISKIEPKTTNTPGKYEYEVTYYKYGDTLSEVNRETLNLKVEVKGMPTGAAAGTPDEEVQKLAERVVQDKVNEKINQILQCRMLWANKDGEALANKAVSEEIDLSGINPTDWNKTYTELSLSLDDKFRDKWSELDKNLLLFKPQSGEFKGYMSVHEDVEKHKESLNKMAKALAFSVNSIHSGRTNAKNGKLEADALNADGTIKSDADYMPFFVNGEVAKNNYTKVENKSVLYTSGNYGGLQNVLDAEKDITAENIAINQVIMDDVMQIKTRTNDNKYGSTYNNKEDGTGDGERALQIAMLRNKLMKVQDITKGSSREDMFKNGNSLTGAGSMGFENYKDGMTIDSAFKSIVNTVGIQEQQAKRMVSNQEKLLKSYKQSRASVSGVSLDEEMTNLVQYQHAYQANAKVISVIDELLDVVVNGLKR